jgi:16S rRNA processing protein RimM
MKLKPVGYFSKPHGLKGHLILQSSFDFKKTLKAFFIEKGGSQAPFFIEEIKPFKEGFLIKLEGINRIEEATTLKNKEVLAEEKFIIRDESTFPYSGYTLIDHHKGEIGIIEELIDTPGNPLLRISAFGKEVLLPYNEHFIDKINKAEKQVLYNAPEGLIDMFMQD